MRPVCCWQHDRRHFANIARIEAGNRGASGVDSPADAPARQGTGDGSLALTFVTTIARLHAIGKALRAARWPTRRPRRSSSPDERGWPGLSSRKSATLWILPSATSRKGTSWAGACAISGTTGEALARHVDDPHPGPDSGVSERAIRPFAVGRRNWLFGETMRGAHASAAFFTLVGTAKANGLNVRDFLHAL